MKRPVVAVFCSSREGIPGVYRAIAEELGTMLGEAGYDLVWGGCNESLMRAVADGFLAGGGKVYAVVPTIKLEHNYRRATELIHVADLGERKKEMSRRADAFVVLPGGIGTLGEFFDVLADQLIAWQGGAPTKPIIVLNQGNIYCSLLELLNSLNINRLVPVSYRQLCQFVSEPKWVLEALNTSLQRR